MHICKINITIMLTLDLSYYIKPTGVEYVMPSLATVIAKLP